MAPDLQKPRFPTHAKAAEALHKAWKKDDPRAAAKWQPKSLATKVGQLPADKDRWWAKRPRLVRLFAEILGVEPEDIIADKVVEDGISFLEMPALGALGVNEEPCWFGRGGWFVHEVLRAGSPRRWRIAPAGAGKSLALTYLRARHERQFATASVPTLETALECADERRALVVEVDMADPARDREAVRRLSLRTELTVILAPFGPSRFVKATAFDFSEPVLPGWDVEHWRPAEGWRERLVTWVDERLERSDRDTKLMKEDALRWLREEDPAERLVATPGDLLALCADFHVHGVDRIPVRQRAERWIERVSSRFPSGDAQTRAWARHSAAGACRALAGGDLLDVASQLGSRGRDAWEALVPETVTSQGAGAAIVVGRLREAGILRGQADGGLALFPRWFAAGAYRSQLATMLETGDPQSWGRLAADASRQVVVDAALDDLSDDGLQAIGGALAGQPKSGSLGYVGAIESTFAAAGRRLFVDRMKLAERDVPHWQAIAMQQLALLQSNEADEGRVHWPLTRADPLTWLADAWSFSLRVPKPKTFSSDLAWDLPGWSDAVSLAELPRSLLGVRLQSGPDLTGLRITSLALEVVARVKDTGLPDDLPGALVPAAVELASDRGWKLQPGHLATLSNSWAQMILADDLSKHEPRDRALRAELLWHALVDTQTVDVGSAIETASQNHRPLLGFMLENVPEETVTTSLKHHGFGTKAFALSLLPERLRQSALTAWAKPARRPPPPFNEVRELLPGVRPEDIDIVLDLARGADEASAAEFFGAVWRMDPARARVEVRRAVTERLASLAGWFATAPPSETDYVIGLMPLPTSNPKDERWFRQWARSRLLNVGASADALFTWMSSGGPPRASKANASSRAP